MPDALFVADAEVEFERALRELFEQRIVFNQTLGLKLDTIGAEQVSASLAMRPSLVGHFGQQRLHGGVISATLDALGGLAIMAALGERHKHQTPAERLAHFAQLGTIDLRIDYLRPGLGQQFRATATVLRLGSRVASTRMEFLDADGTLLATGQAAYIVS